MRFMSTDYLIFQVSEVVVLTPALGEAWSFSFRAPVQQSSSGKYNK